MIGAVVGDIVGSRFEYSNWKSKEFELFHRRKYFTDDTVMTVAVADALLEAGKDANENTVKEQVFEDVPITRNQVTSYSGIFFGGSSQPSDGNFHFTADPEWDSVNNYSF